MSEIAIIFLCLIRSARPHGNCLLKSNASGNRDARDILEEVVGEIYDEDDDGALKAILTSSPKTKGYWSECSLPSSRQK